MNNLKFLVLSVVLVIFLAATSNAQDKKSPGKEKSKVIMEEKGCSSSSSCCSSGGEKTASTIKPYNEVCPVLGNKVSATTKTVEYQGKVYGFCCPGCDDKFAKDPEKYIKNLSDDGKSFNKSKS
jgi:YHS domain-containing protein